MRIFCTAFAVVLAFSSFAGNKALRYCITDAMGDKTRTPEDPIDAATENGTVRIVAAKGEYEAASFFVKPQTDLWTFVPVVHAFRTQDGKTLDASVMDVRLVKCLAQQGKNDIYTTTRDARRLKGCVLLHDDALVETSAETMHNRIRIGPRGSKKYVDVSEKADGKTFEPLISAEEFDIHDAEKIMPLDLKKDWGCEYWLTVKVPEDAAPGLYRGEISLVASAKTLATVPVKLRVLPFALPKPRTRWNPDKPFICGVYYRHAGHRYDDPSYKGSITSNGRNERQFRAELANLRAHGIDACSLGMKLPFPSWVPASKRLYLPAERERAYFRRVLTMMHEAGFVLQPLLAEVPGNLGYGFQYDREKDKANLTRAVTCTREMVRDELGHDDVHFYAVDEATPEKIPLQFAVWEDIRAAGGKVYTTAVTGVVDVLSQRLDTLNAHGRPERAVAKKMHDAGGTVVSYSRPFACHKDGPGLYRRMLGYDVYLSDYDGIYDYACNVSAGNPWNDFDNVIESDVAFVIGTADGWVDTPSWEGYREAIDDVRYATLLQQEVSKAKGNVAKAGEVRAAEAYLAGLDPYAKGFDPASVRATIIRHLLALLTEK